MSVRLYDRIDIPCRPVSVFGFDTFRNLTLQMLCSSLKIKCVYFPRNFESSNKMEKVIVFLSVSSKQ